MGFLYFAVNNFSGYRPSKFTYTHECKTLIQPEVNQALWASKGRQTSSNLYKKKLFLSPFSSYATPLLSSLQYTSRIGSSCRCPAHLHHKQSFQLTISALCTYWHEHPTSPSAGGHSPYTMSTSL